MNREERTEAACLQGQEQAGWSALQILSTEVTDVTGHDSASEDGCRHTPTKQAPESSEAEELPVIHTAHSCPGYIAVHFPEDDQRAYQRELLFVSPDPSYPSFDLYAKLTGVIDALLATIRRSLPVTDG